MGGYAMDERFFTDNPDEYARLLGHKPMSQATDDEIRLAAMVSRLESDVCPVCSGTGGVVETQPSGETFDHDCPRCLGSGKRSEAVPDGQ